MFCPFARVPQTFVVAVGVFCQDIIQKAHLQNATSAGVLVHHFMCILISWWVDVGNSSSDIMRNSKSAVVRLCCLTEGLRTTQQRFYHIFSLMIVSFHLNRPNSNSVNGCLGKMWDLQECGEIFTPHNYHLTE